MFAGENEICLQVKALKDTWYKHLQYQVTSILQKIETLQQQLSLVIQERKWTERKGLIELTQDLVKFFRENVCHNVSHTFSTQQVANVDIKYCILITINVLAIRLFSTFPSFHLCNRSCVCLTIRLFKGRKVSRT